MPSPEELGIDPSQLSDKDREMLNSVSGKDAEDQNDSRLEAISNEEIQGRLEELNADYYLLIHQTDAEVAAKIIIGKEDFNNLLTGMALGASPEAATNILSELDLPPSQRTQLTHRGADGALIMAFPRQEVQRRIDSSEADKMQGTSTIDDILLDNYNDGKITQLGLPNKFIYGYYSKGGLKLNPNFNPQF